MEFYENPRSFLSVVFLTRSQENVKMLKDALYCEPCDLFEENDRKKRPRYTTTDLTKNYKYICNCCESMDENIENCQAR